MGKLYQSICSFSNLSKTFDFLWKKNRRPGPDGISLYDLLPIRDSYIRELSSSLINGSYHPTKDVYLTKPYYPGATKILTYACMNVREKLVEYAIKNYLYCWFDESMTDFCCAYRKRWGEKKVNELVTLYTSKGYIQYVSLDIKGFFKSIDQDRLMDMLNVLDDDNLSLLISDSLHFSHQCGIPSGHVLSPLLSNYYLNDLDWELAKRKLKVIRYADNYCFAAKQYDQLEDIIVQFKYLLQDYNMLINDMKTRYIVAPKIWQDIIV